MKEKTAGNKKQGRKIPRIAGGAAALVLYVLAALLLVRVIAKSGTWPSGDDVMYHIHRGEKVYEAWKAGHFYVALDMDWYNGVEILRYWSPLPAYVMALCIAVTGGNALNGYLVFTGCVYGLSAVIWLTAGFRRGRPYLGFFLGLLWFFMPQNVVSYFQSGNLAGMLANACAMPLFICFLGEFQDRPGGKAALRLALATALMAFCHSGFALLSMLTGLLWILIRKLMNRMERTGMQAVFTVVCGFLLTGFWFLASRTGVTQTNYTEQLAASFQPLAVTLNPADRILSGFGHSYFGLAAFLICVTGTFLARKKSCRAGFLTAVLVCFLTSESAYRMIRVIPGGSFLWTSRMINTSYALLFLSLLEWDTLKKKFQILGFVLLAVDSAFSMPLVYGNRNSASVTDRFNDEQRATLIREAKDITDQRIALIDASSLGSTGAYLTSDWNGETYAVFGAGYEAAVTRTNITMLNRAANDGAYLYLFDRALELGSDTVLIQIRQLSDGGNDIKAVTEAAERVGYALRDSNEEYLLYHMETGGTFGTASSYKGIAIGSAAEEIAEYYPAFQAGESSDLSDYSLEELSRYETVYLNGFTMSDRAESENMIRTLSDQGVRIYVCADGIPETGASKTQSFLGVTCSPVSFSNGYPMLDTTIGSLNTTLFPEGTGVWNTVYLNGLDEVLGSISENDLTLDFFGTKYNDNIVFMGLNLSYYYALTKDSSAQKLLSMGMDISSAEIPDRTVIPLSCEAGYDEIRITSPKDQVNTALAWHDIFESDSAIRREHNLTVVNAGTTVIRFRRPYLIPGLLITIAAAVLLGAQNAVYRKRREKECSLRKGDDAV